MRDHYDTIIVQFRARDDAANKLADLCRKKDVAIRMLESRINELKDETGSLIGMVEDWIERARRKMMP